MVLATIRAITHMPHQCRAVRVASRRGAPRHRHRAIDDRGRIVHRLTIKGSVVARRGGAGLSALVSDRAQPALSGDIDGSLRAHDPASARAGKSATLPEMRV